MIVAAAAITLRLKSGARSFSSGSTPANIYAAISSRKSSMCEIRSLHRPLAASTRRHRQCRPLSTASSSSPLDRSTPVEITVTPSSSSSSPSSSCSSSSPPSRPSGTNLAMSPDRAAEEEMLSLQSDLRAHFRHASYDTALDVASRLLDLATSHFGTLHPATASAYNNVGLMNKMLGRYEEARNAYHESLRVYGEVCGKDHASYAAALSNLGMLERGRAMEGEARGDGDGGAGGESDDAAEEEEGTTKLSAMERMRLNESAIEYLDEAYRIRLSELGGDHPHTVSSRSQLGSAMAASVIAERRGMMGGLIETELRRLKKSRNVADASGMEAYVPEAIARAASGVSSKSKLTRRRWEAAEEHLRGALDTAVENPRGEGVGPLIHLPTGGGGGKVGEDKGGGGLTLPSRREDKEGMSKKEKKKLGKEKIRDKRRANATGSGSEAERNDDGGDGGGKHEAIRGVASRVTTLSAATAAQNLAVFLRNYSDWMRLSLLDETTTTTKGDDGSREKRRSEGVELLNRTIREARHLYESALHVRSSILPPHHPDVIATKFSLAELLDSPGATKTMIAGSATSVTSAGIDSERANRLREEILSAYNVEEREEDGR